MSVSKVEKITNGVSVIIPVYNGENHIVKCLDTLLNDKYCKEIIVVNDGSIDNTENIVKKIQQKSEKVKVITVKNGGVSKARNIGIKVAICDYIFFLDSDDYLTCFAISSIYSFALKKSLDLVCINVDEKKVIKATDNQYSKVIQDLTFLDNEQIGKQLINANTRMAVAKLYKRSIILDNHILFDQTISYAEDIIFVLNYCCYINSIGFYSNASYIVSNSNASSLSKKYCNNIKEVLIKREQALMRTFQKYSEYKLAYYNVYTGFGLQRIMAYSDNLFRVESPYNFYKCHKLIKIELMEFLLTSEYQYPKKYELPKKRNDRIFYKVIKTKSAFIITLAYCLKNKIKKLKLGR